MLQEISTRHHEIESLQLPEEPSEEDSGGRKRKVKPKIAMKKMERIE